MESHDELANNIAEIILSETFINKNTLRPRIKAILNAYMRDSIVRAESKLPNATERQKHIMAINRGKAEVSFYRNKLMQYIPLSDRRGITDECVTHLRGLGYK